MSRLQALFRQPSIVVGKDFEVPKSFDWQFLGMKCSLYAASFRVRVEGGREGGGGPSDPNDIVHRSEDPNHEGETTGPGEKSLA